MAQEPVEAVNCLLRIRKITLRWFKTTWPDAAKMLKKIEEEQTPPKDES